MNDFGDISMQQIEIFLTVADCNSVTEAARKLYLSQSTATRQMQKLESYMNVTLFQRTNRGMELTHNGEELYWRLKRLYSRMKATFYDAKEARKGTKKVVHVACVDNSEIFDEVAILIKQFENLYPDCTVDLKLCTFQELREGILTGVFDCVCTYSVSAKNLVGIETRYYKRYDTYFAVAASSCAIEGDRLNYKKLADAYIYMSTSARYDLQATRDLGICELHGFQPKGIRYHSDEEAIAMVVTDNVGFSICGPGFGSQIRDRIRLFKVEKPLREEQYMVILWNPESSSDIGRKFVESIPYIRLERDVK